MSKQQYLYDEITKLIIGQYYRVRNELKARPGYEEREKAMALSNALRQLGKSTCLEVPIVHRHNGARIGKGFIDLVVECRVVVIVRDTPKLSQKDTDILDRYLEDSGLAVGLLLNFDSSDEKGIVRRYCESNDPNKRNP